jgi:hypothetical protein
VSLEGEDDRKQNGGHRELARPMPDADDALGDRTHDGHQHQAVDAGTPGPSRWRTEGQLKPAGG